MLKITKILFSFLFSFFLAALFLFPQSCFFLCIETSVKIYCKKKLHATLHYESCLVTPEGVSLNGLRLLRPNHFDLKVDCALIKPRLNVKERTFFANIEVDRLLLTNQKAKTVNPPLYDLPFLNLNIHTVVKEGTLLLYDHHSKGPLFQKIGFSLDQKMNHGGMEAELVLIDLCTVVCRQKKEQILELTSDFSGHKLKNIQNLLFYFFEQQLPTSLTAWDVDSGEIYGHLSALLDGQSLSSIGGDISLENIHATHQGYRLQSGVENLHANFLLDLRGGCELWQGEFSLTQGTLAPEAWGNLFDIQQLDATLSVDRGIVTQSSISGVFMGMQGKIATNFHDPNEMLRFAFYGNARQMLPLLPPPLQAGFAQGFDAEDFSLNCVMRAHPEGMQLEGTLDVLDPEQSNNQISFGCRFKKEPCRSKLDLFPPTFSKDLSLFLENMGEQFGMTAKRVGWVKAENLPIEKFISPFLFRAMPIEAAGLVNLTATFDEKQIVFFYDLKGCQIDSPSFCLDIQHLAKSSQTFALHHVDLETFAHKGMLPIERASYTQKKIDLKLVNCRSLVKIENGKIAFHETEAHWQDLDFFGNLMLDIKHVQDVDLQMSTECVQGSMESARAFLAHFNQSEFWKIPLQGQVQSGPNECQVHYHFSPKAELVKAQMAGTLVANYTHNVGTFDEIQSSFFCDLIEQKCSFGKSSASYHLPFGELSYQIESEGFAITNLPNIDFSIEALLSDCKKSQRLVTLESQKEGQTRQVQVTSKDFALEVALEKEKVFLTKLQYRDCFAQGKLEKESHWVLNDLLVSMGTLGTFCVQAEQFQAQIIGLECDLEKVARRFFPTIAPLVASTTLSGAMQLVWDPQNYALKLDQLDTTLTTSASQQPLLLDRVTYFPKEGRLCVENLHFQLASQMNKLEVLEKIRNYLSPDSKIAGKVTFSLWKDQCVADFCLQDTFCTLGNHRLALEELSLLFDQEEILACARTSVLGEEPWLYLQTQREPSLSATLSLSDRKLAFSQLTPENALVAKCQMDRQKGWQVTEICGKALGLEANFLHQPSAPLGLLAGELFFSLGSFPNAIQKKIDDYCLGGRCHFDGTICLDSLKNFQIDGLCLINRLQVGQVHLSTARFDLNVTPHRALMRELVVKDWTANGYCDRAFITFTDDPYFYIDHLKLENVRPYYLCNHFLKKNKKRSSLGSMLIKSATLRKCGGKVDDLATIVGQGEVEIAKITKRTFLDQLLFLPSEISARIGLDFTTLVPAQGKVIYELNDQKVVIKELQQMYSDAKRSLFYLAKGMPSYVDFSGNLNIQMRMKQSGLLMKLTEFFTLNVRGNLKKPTFSLCPNNNDN